MACCRDLGRRGACDRGWMFGRHCQRWYAGTDPGSSLRNLVGFTYGVLYGEGVLGLTLQDWVWDRASMGQGKTPNCAYWRQQRMALSAADNSRCRRAGRLNLVFGRMFSDRRWLSNDLLWR